MLNNIILLIFLERVYQKSKSIDRKGRKEFREERKGFYFSILTLRSLRQLCVLCG